MNTTPFPLSPHRPATRRCVLVVTSQADHVQSVRRMAAEHPLGTHVEWARDDLLAIDLALELRPDLVLIDARLSGDRAPTLQRTLARGLRDTGFYTCHERGGPLLAKPTPDTLHWDELPMLLRHWAPRHSTHSVDRLPGAQP